jgi:hypothetical protein
MVRQWRKGSKQDRKALVCSERAPNSWIDAFADLTFLSYAPRISSGKAHMYAGYTKFRGSYLHKLQWVNIIYSACSYCNSLYL